MNNTQIDYLIQLPLPRTDGGGPPTRGRDDRAPFDRHFQILGETGSAPPPPPPLPPRSNSSRDDTPRPPKLDEHNSGSSASTQDNNTDTSKEANIEAADSRPDRESSETETAEVVAASNAAGSVKDDPVEEHADDNSDRVEKNSPEFPSDRATKPTEKLSRKIDNGLNSEAPADAVSNSSAEPTAEDAETLPVKVQARETGAEANADIDVNRSERSPRVATSDPTAREALVEGDANIGKSADEGQPEAKHVKARGDDKKLETFEPGDTNRKHRVPSELKSEESPSGDPKGSIPNRQVNSPVVHPQNPANGKSESKRSAKRGDDLVQAVGQPADPSAASQPSAEATARPASSSLVNVAPVGTLNLGIAADESAAVNVNAAHASKGGKESKEGVLATFARFERGGLFGARGGQRNGSPQESVHVDPARFVNRVARAIQSAQDRGTPLLLRLSPPELGSLRMELSLQQGVLSATVEADNQNARQVLLDNLPALRDRLADQNIRIERFDVDVRRDGEGGQQRDFTPQQRGDGQPGDAPQRHTAPRDGQGIETPQTVPTPSITITTSSINVVA